MAAMLGRLFGGGGSSGDEVPTGTGSARIGGVAAAAKTVNLLVIDADFDGTKWPEIFKGRTARVRRRPGAVPAAGDDGDVSDGKRALDAAKDATASDTSDAAAGDATADGAGGDGEAADAAAGVDVDGVHIEAAGGESAATDTAEGDVWEERPVRVVQVGWGDFNLTTYPDDSGGVVVDVFPRTSSKGERERGFCIKPDFLLIRNEVRGVSLDQDFRNLLYGFAVAGIPSCNSIQSILMTNERPLTHAALCDIQRRLGNDACPLISQTYYPNHREMLITPSYPLVAKVGHAHAGFGKAKIEHHRAFGDLKSVIALTPMYVTAEPFLEGEYDLRIQKIGDMVRAFKRVSMSGDWKTNTGTSIAEEIEVTPAFRRWVVEASKSFGGMDICTVDAIHNSEDGKDYILEMNGTSSGLFPDREIEDNECIRDLVLQRITESVTF